jgi:hypothetical protein
VANLVQFLTTQRDAAKTTKTNATQNVTTAKSDAKTKRDAATAAAAAWNAKRQEIAGIQRDLAAIPTSSDGTALVALLQTALLAAHAAQADLVRKTQDADTADSVVKQRGAELDEAATRLAGLESMLAEATTVETARNQLKQGASTTVQTAAATALNSSPFTVARTRIENDFPATLRARAVASANVELNQMAIATAVDARAAFALSDKLSATQKAQRSLEIAEAALADYVKTAAAKLQKAIDVMTRVAKPAESPLTAAEKAAIADKAAERNTAADKEIDFSNKQLAFDTAQDVVDAAAAPSAAQITARDTARTDRDTAKLAVDAAAKDTLHEWEAAVPDVNWQMFADYDRARRDLEFLRDTAPGGLVTAVNNGEDAVVTAVQAADTAVAAAGAARANVARTAEVVTAGDKLREVRTLSALRGDF